MIPDPMPETPATVVVRYPVVPFADIPSRCDDHTWHLALSQGCAAPVRVPQTMILHTLGDDTPGDAWEYAEIALPDLDSISQAVLLHTRADELWGQCLACSRFFRYHHTEQRTCKGCGSGDVQVFAPVGGSYACGCDEGADLCRHAYYGAECVCGCHRDEVAAVLLAA